MLITSLYDLQNKSVKKDSTEDGMIKMLILKKSSNFHTT